MFACRQQIMREQIGRYKIVHRPPNECRKKYLYVLNKSVDYRILNFKYDFMYCYE